MNNNQILTGNPQDYYAWFNRNAIEEEDDVLEPIEKQKKTLKSIDIQTNLNPSYHEMFKRIIELYILIAQKIIQNIKSQLISDDEKFNEILRRLETRIDNKLRLDNDGKKFISINNTFRFDGSIEKYNQWFKSSKNDFRKIFTNITRELINTVKGQIPEEEGKSFISDTSLSSIEIQKDPEIIAVDLDNTLITSDEKPINGAKEALEKLKEKGYKLVIYTARFSATPEQEWQSLITHITNVLNQHQIPFDELSITKPICKFYIDDRGLTFTNWNDVMDTIDQKEDFPEEPQKIEEKPELDIKLPEEVKSTFNRLY